MMKPLCKTSNKVSRNYYYFLLQSDVTAVRKSELGILVYYECKEKSTRGKSDTAIIIVIIIVIIKIFILAIIKVRIIIIFEFGDK